MESVHSEASAFWQNGACIEELLAFLRKQGFNQPRSVDALVSITAIDRGHAQTAALTSETWKDQYERNLIIHEQLQQALIQLSQEGSIKLVTIQSHENPSSADSKILSKNIESLVPRQSLEAQSGEGG
jgi:hypothetical protein